MSARAGETGRDEAAVALAAEYVLDLLPPREREEAARRLETDAGFRRLVVEWSEDFARMAGEVAPVAPPKGVRRSLKRAVRAEARGMRRRRGGRRLMGALGWLIGAGAAAVSALVILSVALPVVAPPYPGPLYRAELAGEGTDLSLEARFDPRDGVLTIERTGGAAAPGRALEMWLIPEGGGAPVSLGVLAQAGNQRLSLPEGLRGALPGATLAVSDAPPEGSPGGAPTGRILARGIVGAI